MARGNVNSLQKGGHSLEESYDLVCHEGQIW